MLRLVVLFCAWGCGALLLSGCRDFNEFDEYRAMEDGIAPTGGNAVAHNKAVQTIDPWPREAGDTVIDIDGTRILDAVRKYESGGDVDAPK